jgi:hypothetical protein
MNFETECLKLATKHSVADNTQYLGFRLVYLFLVVAPQPGRISNPRHSYATRIRGIHFWRSVTETVNFRPVLPATNPQAKFTDRTGAETSEVSGTFAGLGCSVVSATDSFSQ